MPTSSRQTVDNDYKWMNLALEQAKESALAGEVPVGAVLVKNDQLLASTGNRLISDNDPTSHAEILAIRKGAELLNNYRIPGTTLYVTLEPCIMCMGAIIQARIERLVFGAFDPKTGAAKSRYRIGTDSLLNHTLAVVSGVMAEDCGTVLKIFFKQRRRGCV